MYDNASLEKPEVLIQQLEAGKAYIATVTALNKKVILSSSSSSPSSSPSSSLFLSSTSSYFSFFQGASLSVHKMVETLQQPELQLVEEKIEVRLMMMLMMVMMMEKTLMMLMMMMMVEKMLMMMEKVLVLIVQGYNCVNANLKRAPFPSKMQKATFSETINRCNVQHISINLKINLNFALYTANKFSQYVKTWQLAIFSHSFIPGR